MKRKARKPPVAPQYMPLTDEELSDLDRLYRRRAVLEMGLSGTNRPDPEHISVLRLIAEVKERRAKA